MERALPNDSVLSAEYELFKTLGLIDDDNCNGSVTDNEFGMKVTLDISGIRDGYDFIACYGRDAWDKLYQAREARHRKIVLWEFIRRLPNISERAKNGLFDVFIESLEFGVMEHNALLDALADPNKGWNLQDY